MGTYNILIIVRRAKRSSMDGPDEPGIPSKISLAGGGDRKSRESQDHTQRRGQDVPYDSLKMA